MRTLRNVLYGALLGGAILFCVGCDQPDTAVPRQQILLTVNGEEVPAKRLESMLFRVQRNLGDLPVVDREAFGRIKKRALQELIETTLLYQKAREAGVVVDEQDIEQQMELLHEGTAPERRTRLLRDAYQSDEAWRQAVRDQLMRERAVAVLFPAPVSMPDETVQQYYRDHMEEFKLPSGVHLAQIVVKDHDTADTLYKKLRRNPDDFSQLARENSIAPEAPQGGDMGLLEQKTMPDEFAPAFRLREGAIGRPVHTSYGWHIFHVRRKIQGTTYMTLAEARRQIEQTLAQQAQMEAYREGMNQWLGHATIEIDKQVLDAISAS